MRREKSPTSAEAGTRSFLAVCGLTIALSLTAVTPVAVGAVVAGQPASPGVIPLSAAAATPAKRPVSPANSPADSGTRVWTRREMLEAKPMELVVPGSSAGFPANRSGASVSRSPAPSEAITGPSLPGFRTNGKLFFTLGQPPDNEYSCSGTMVRSQRRNVVFTAGHCVFDTPTEAEPEQWAKAMTFVPGYNESDQPQPYGQFPVADMVTTKGWKERRLQSFDLAVLSLEGQPQDVVGARRIEFGADLRNRSLEIFGYPAKPEPEFDGRKLIRCVPATVGYDLTRLEPYPFGAKPCQLWEGSSGGGWILDNRYLVSVVSYGYCTTPEPPGPRTCGPEIYGPQLGSAAINLINSASIGGTATPTVRVVRRPPLKVKKRAVSFGVAGDGSTPIRQFKVRLDRKPAVITGPTIKISQLSPGRHTLWIRSMDQTRKLSTRTVKQTFRVVAKRKPRKNRF